MLNCLACLSRILCFFSAQVGYLVMLVLNHYIVSACVYYTMLKHKRLQNLLIKYYFKIFIIMWVIVKAMSLSTALFNHKWSSSFLGICFLTFGTGNRAWSRGIQGSYFPGHTSSLQVSFCYSPYFPFLLFKLKQLLLGSSVLHFKNF